MADTFKKLYQGQPGTGATTLYTVPASTSAIVKHITVSNPTGASRTVKLWQSGTADTNVILPTATILAGGWAEFDGTVTLAAADTISGICDAATALTVTIHGDEVT